MADVLHQLPEEQGHRDESALQVLQGRVKRGNLYPEQHQIGMRWPSWLVRPGQKGRPTQACG